MDAAAERRNTGGTLLRLFDRALAGLACALLLALLVTVLAGVVTRAADAPLIWTDEGARFLMVWLAGTGWTIAGRRRAHVRIRFFQDLLPAPAHRAVEIAIQLAMAGFAGAVAWFAWGLVLRNSELDATSLPISMAWLYAPLIPAGLVMALQSLGQAFERRPASAPGPLAEELVE